MKQVSTTLADRLVQARTDRGLSQEDVAKSAGMTQQSYSDLERGISKRTTRIGSLAHALRVDAYWLETGTGDSLMPARVADDTGDYVVSHVDDQGLVKIVLGLAKDKRAALLALLM